MIGIFIALAVLLGVGGTVAVADNARPGEALFGVDQAVENLRLKLANDEKGNKLRVKFVKERVVEIEEILAEKSETEDGVKVENEEATDIEEDVDAFEEDQQEEIKIAVEGALNLLAGFEGTNPEVVAIVEQLNSYIAKLPTGASIEVEGNKLRIEFENETTGEKVKVKYDVKNDRLKTEVRSEDEKIKIEIKNGGLEIKSKTENDNDEESISGLKEAEAKIFPDRTIVEVEVGDEKTTFITSATTREAIVAAIVAQVPGLTIAGVEAVLEIETEDWDEDIESESEDSDDNEEEDKDEDDRSGSNSGSN